MEEKNRARRPFIGMLFVLMAVSACTTIPELKVTYQLPRRSEALKGKKVFVGFEDARKSKELIGKGAQEQYKNFPGNITLFFTRGDAEGFKIGIYHVPALFNEVFKERLEHLGAEVVSESKESEVEMMIVLKDLLLDLADRDWVVRIDYEARLMKQGELLASQTISGQAERLKVLGRRDADKVMGEIFSDVVNRLDVPRLFQQAGLI
ncbi:MAG: hypothetical protein AMK69_15815 [Nitrospira bacterium SG8_3]|nr:MAG: hypothetical protein AMK69_15815 [Nitrospira bacterium SG8_3]